MQMSDQQPTDQQPQPKAKHAGGRPRKPKPAPPLPPPPPNSLEETLLMGDQAALKGTPATQLRWVSQRVLLVKEIQARKDADLHDALEIENKRLQESIEACKKTKQNLENELGKKHSELVLARTENDKIATKLKESADEHDKLLNELNSKIRASESKAKGLLAFVKCACLQMKGCSEGKHIKYAAELMGLSEHASKEARRLTELVTDPEAHRERYAAYYWNLRQGPVEQKLNSEQFAQLMSIEKERTELSMRADWEKLAFETSSIIPEEVMNQAFELLGVTREQVVKQLDTEQEERKVGAIASGSRVGSCTGSREKTSSPLGRTNRG